MSKEIISFIRINSKRSNENIDCIQTKPIQCNIIKPGPNKLTDVQRSQFDKICKRNNGKVDFCFGSEIEKKNQDINEINAVNTFYTILKNNGFNHIIEKKNIYKNNITYILSKKDNVDVKNKIKTIHLIKILNSNSIASGNDNSITVDNITKDCNVINCFNFIDDFSVNHLTNKEDSSQNFNNFERDLRLYNHIKNNEIYHIKIYLSKINNQFTLHSPVENTVEDTLQEKKDKLKENNEKIKNIDNSNKNNFLKQSTILKLFTLDDNTPLTYSNINTYISERCDENLKSKKQKINEFVQKNNIKDRKCNNSLIKNYSIQLEIEKNNHEIEKNNHEIEAIKKLNKNNQNILSYKLINIILYNFIHQNTLIKNNELLQNEINNLEKVSYLSRGELNLANRAMSPIRQMTNELIMNTMIHYMAQFNRFNMLLELFKCECFKNLDMNVKNALGETPLHIAVRYNNINIIIFLIKYANNVDLLVKNSKGETPFLYSINYNHLDIMYLLYNNKGFSLDSDNDNNNLLHICLIHKPDTTIVSFLVQRGVDIDQENNEGKLPMDILEEKFKKLKDKYKDNEKYKKLYSDDGYFQSKTDNVMLKFLTPDDYPDKLFLEYDSIRTIINNISFTENQSSDYFYIKEFECYDNENSIMTGIKNRKDCTDKGGKIAEYNKPFNEISCINDKYQIIPNIYTIQDCLTVNGQPKMVFCVDKGCMKNKKLIAKVRSIKDLKNICNGKVITRTEQYTQCKNEGHKLISVVADFICMDALNNEIKLKNPGNFKECQQQGGRVVTKSNKKSVSVEFQNPLTYEEDDLYDLKNPEKYMKDKLTEEFNNTNTNNNNNNNNNNNCFDKKKILCIVIIMLILLFFLMTN